MKLLLALLTIAQNSFASEANLVIPDLKTVSFGSFDGHSLLLWGILICVLGMFFGIYHFSKVAKLPVHKSMLEVSELIYETCKTYLLTQGKFLMILWAFIAVIILFYFGYLMHFTAGKIFIILLFSVIGILGSYSVAWFGMRMNTYANSRTAFSVLKGYPYPAMDIPLRAGISIGTVLISVELIIMLIILLFVPGEYSGPCFIGFAIGESLGAAALRIAGGIFTKIADIGSDLMKIVFKIKEDDARNPGVIADCTGDNAGDSVGPTADGFETYGVTGVALITFIVLAVKDPTTQIQLLVWIFVMRVAMIATSIISYWLNGAYFKSKYENEKHFNFELPLTSLVWLTSFVSIAMTYILSYILIPDLGGDNTYWYKLATIITCGTLAGAIIPEFVKVFTSTKSKHVREVLNASKEGGASLNILSGFVAGNFSAYWLGMAIVVLMGIAYYVSTAGLDLIMISPAIFAFGLVAFGFLGMGPVTIAVDSYGPVTDNAQSIFELSTIETIPNAKEEIKKEFGFEPNFEAKAYLEENDGAGNTFKATAKPVLIGTAVVGATTLIFSIIQVLRQSYGDASAVEGLSILNPLFLLGLIVGGAMIYWFSGASNQAVTTGAYRATEFIKNNMKLDGVTKASVSDSKKVVEICTQYAQKGMFNIFLSVFFATLAFACLNHYFFIGYLISIALFGLFQAIFMANAGGAWDNAKKLVETELNMKGTDLHAATVVGDTVGDPFKDTASVSMNPIIKFTTLFGLLAVELAIELSPKAKFAAFLIFFILSVVFVWRSFYKMRIKED
ncbi:MAG: sodium-translocating pyrophosphatase [Elusimicrobiales bacterium]|nr:sodium-translocating pyrophosphatase [Elusimicrobiales bacterium]HPO94578.1 sodium-translocating pyrophosphatase [Elusimicrobiales bacterium]